MPELNTLSKKACVECGGDVAWDAAKQALVCPYCGTVVPGKIQPDGQTIQEHDLAEALQRVPDDQRGWRENKTAVKCQSCNAISIFDPSRVAQRCDFCGSPAIVPYEETKDPIRPESVLPFQVPESKVRDDIHHWYGSRWFAPNKLKKIAQTDTLKGVYLPYWTFDAQADATWTAESGYYYYVSETFTNSEGKTETKQVQKVRWEPSRGQVHHFFDDTLVPGTVGIDSGLLGQIEPFPTTNQLQPYDPSFIRNWVVERYQIDLSQAAERSQGRMEDELRAICAAQVPGDTYRNLQVDSHYHERTFKHILLPIWLLTYTYGPKVFQVLVNGFTGKIAGKHPFSWIKIILAVVAALFIVLLLASMKSNH